MILLRNRLIRGDTLASCSDKMGNWKSSTYLKTPKGSFVYIHKIIIYDTEANKAICDFPVFKNCRDKLVSLQIGYTSNAEAFICGSSKTYETLVKRKAPKFDGEVFYTGSGAYSLYLPKDLFDFSSEKRVIERQATVKKIKKRYTFNLKNNSEISYTGEALLETIPLLTNEKFISDFFKTINFNNKLHFHENPETIFKVLNADVKDNIISNMQEFIQAYSNFQVET